ncbi:ParA family protein (plasmid) [Alkalibacillus sp. S2W]|uniref:ParA family protein n=1 Tax=Alkalibacillus sp. S2W TaxID=3386553 RepID=UPI00398CF87C
MKNKTIAFSLQKGGVGKSTISGVSSFLLSQKGYKVLHVDMDSQANSTQLLTEVEDATETFDERDVLEAIKQQNPHPFILTISENLDILPSTDYLATLDQFLFNEFSQSPGVALFNIIEKIRESYDFIIIDTPPALSILTINSLFAADYVVIPTNLEKFSYNAIERFLGTVQEVNEFKTEQVNSSVEVLGILRSMHDKRRSDNKIFSDMLEETYQDDLFETVIHRRATTGRLPIFGFQGNTELSSAVRQHRSFIEELIQRV